MPVLYRPAQLLCAVAEEEFLFCALCVLCGQLSATNRYAGAGTATAGVL